MAYKRFEDGDVIISSENVSTPVWSKPTMVVEGNTGSYNPNILYDNEMEISEVQKGNPISSPYYLDVVYNPDKEVVPKDLTVEHPIQFSLAYANVSASVENIAPRVVYGQYRSLVLGDEESIFRFGNKESIKDEDIATEFFIFSIERARYKERLMPGSFELELQLEGNTVSKFVDSGTKNSVVEYVDSGRKYDIVKKTDPESTEEGKIYGWFLPDMGLILLDKNKLGVEAVEGSDIREEFFNCIKSIKLSAEETVTSNLIFARARNAEFNYSINPTNLRSTGELLHDVMINAPQAYITTVGLFNDSNDLLAVAKLSRPLLKDFTKEALIRIKLDY